MKGSRRRLYYRVARIKTHPRYTDGGTKIQNQPDTSRRNAGFKKSRLAFKGELVIAVYHPLELRRGNPSRRRSHYLTADKDARSDIITLIKSQRNDPTGTVGVVNTAIGRISPLHLTAKGVQHKRGIRAHSTAAPRARRPTEHKRLSRLRPYTQPTLQEQYPSCDKQSVHRFNPAVTVIKTVLASWLPAPLRLRRCSCPPVRVTI